MSFKSFKKILSKSIPFVVFLSIISLLISIITSNYASDSEMLTAKSQQEQKTDGIAKTGRVTTIGDASWILLDLLGKPSENVPAILEAIDKFKKNHPKLQIIRREIERHDPDCIDQEYRTEGIWIDHKKK